MDCAASSKPTYPVADILNQQMNNSSLQKQLSSYTVPAPNFDIQSLKTAVNRRLPALETTPIQRDTPNNPRVAPTSMAKVHAYSIQTTF